MGKKKQRAKYTSKGERASVAKKNKVTETTYLDTQINKWNAFLSGKNVMFTIPNPNPNDTRARFVKISGKELYGDYRRYRNHYSMYRDGGASNGS